MSNTQSLADQLGWCNTTRNQLQDLEADLRHTVQVYFTTIDQMRDDQYLHEAWQRLLPFRDEFQARAEATCRHIDDAHIDYVNQQADSVSTQLSAIMNLPSVG